MSDEAVNVNSDKAFAAVIAELTARYHAERNLWITIESGNRRTSKQNRALHKWFGMLADVLNAAGLDMRKVLKPAVEIPWRTTAVKEHLWRPIQEIVIGKESTADADRTEYTKVFEILAHHMATKHGIAVPEWPRKDAD